MTFLRTNVKEDEYLMHTSINEVKISRDKELYLGLGSLSNIHTGYTLFNLYYWETISKVKSDELTSAMIHLEHFHPRYD